MVVSSSEDVKFLQVEFDRGDYDPEELVDWIEQSLNEANQDGRPEDAQRLKALLGKLNKELPARKPESKANPPDVARELRQALLGKAMAKLGPHITFRGWSAISTSGPGSYALWTYIPSPTPMTVEVFFNNSQQVWLTIAVGKRVFCQGGDILATVNIDIHSRRGQLHLSDQAGCMPQLKTILAPMLKPVINKAEIMAQLSQ